MIIPHSSLSMTALTGLIEEFVTRNGTDYGEAEIALEIKVKQVEIQLEEGRAVILYDDKDCSFSIVFAEKGLPCVGTDL
ncbi:MAG: YheU family protein [Gammaproteobacteria bacterium]|nr:YheU family protein [Gammaproteobacteria bacterium]